MAKRAKSESTVRLRRIGVLSLGKVMALFGLVLGLVAGILFTLLSSIGSVPAELALMAPYGKLSIVVLPILYLIMYFLVGIVSAALYNLFARWIGGVELDIG